MHIVVLARRLLIENRAPASRTVCHVVVRWINPRACLHASPLRQRDAAFHGALQAAELLKDLDLTLEDGLLDPGDLGADLRVEPGRAGFPSPVIEHRPGPV